MAELTIEEQLARDSSMVLLYGWAVNMAGAGLAKLEQSGDNVIVNCDASVSHEFGFDFDQFEQLPNLLVPEILDDYFFAVPWVHARLHQDVIPFLELACGPIGMDSYQLILRLPLDKRHTESLKEANMLSMTELHPDHDEPKDRYIIVKV